jgi:hypothetical protein
VSWDELPALRGGDHWTIRSAQTRLDKGNEPWAEYAKSAKSLTTAMKTLGFQAMTRPEALTLELGIADWRSAVGKTRLTDAALLSIVNQRVPDIDHAIEFETLLPSDHPKRNWKVGRLRAGIPSLDDPRLPGAVARAIAATGERCGVACPSSLRH